MSESQSASTLVSRVLGGETSLGHDMPDITNRRETRLKQKRERGNAHPAAPASILPAASFAALALRRAALASASSAAFLAAISAPVPQNTWRGSGFRGADNTAASA